MFGLTLAAHTSPGAQSAIVTGQVVLRDDGRPLGHTTIAVLSQGTQQLSRDNGGFALIVPPGQVRLRCKRIGFVPRDTALTLALERPALRGETDLRASRSV